MSAALAVAWPGSRVLLGWWREFAERQPRQLYVSRLLFHHVEALVQVSRSQTLDRWQQALLHFAHAGYPHRDLLNPFADLQLEPQVLAQFVRDLIDNGFVHQNGSGLWQLSPTGRQALETGSRRIAREERRSFTFVDPSSQGQPSHYLKLAQAPPTAAYSTASPSPSFDVNDLQASIGKSSEWKTRCRFPQDVEALLLPSPEKSHEANQRRVILDSPEQRLLVLLRTATSNGGAALLGFALKSEGWQRDNDPSFVLADGGAEVFPDLAADPPLESWRQAWQAWAHPRNLPSAEVEACRLERVEHRLIVRAPAHLLERLRAARSDAMKQEAWLLAGDERIRTAAQMELVPLGG